MFYKEFNEARKHRRTEEVTKYDFSTGCFYNEYKTEFELVINKKELLIDMENIENIIEKLEADGYEKDPQSEILKLEVGEHVEIRLQDIQPYEQNGKTKHRYKVKDLENDAELTLFGTAMIDQLFSQKEIGDQFILLRIEDKDVGRPQPMKQYRTFSKKE